MFSRICLGNDLVKPAGRRIRLPEFENFLRLALIHIVAEPPLVPPSMMDEERQRKLLAFENRIVHTPLCSAFPNGLVEYRPIPAERSRPFEILLRCNLFKSRQPNRAPAHRVRSSARSPA